MIDSILWEHIISTLKSKIVSALVARDFDTLANMALQDRRVFTKLMALALDKEDVTCWYAIEGMGVCARAVSRKDPAIVRNLVQRIIWSAREESGGMGWSAPELLAEIACASPKQFADIPPIVVSLHSEDEEKVFLKGVLWAIRRMAEAGIRQVPGAEEVVLKSLGDPDPVVRGLAVRAAYKAEIDGAIELIKGMTDDQESFIIYEDGRMLQKTVESEIKAAAGM